MTWKNAGHLVSPMEVSRTLGQLLKPHKTGTILKKNQDEWKAYSYQTRKRIFAKSHCKQEIQHHIQDMGFIRC